MSERTGILKNSFEEKENKEKSIIANVKKTYKLMPKYLKDFIDDGTLIQWRQYPHILFVVGISDKRIRYDIKTKRFTKSHHSFKNWEQEEIFMEIYKNIIKHQKKELK